MPSFWEKLQVDGQEMEVYASVPSGSGPFSAIVVAQHGGGVDKFIQTMCDRFAGEGYAAVAPSLDHRITAEMLADGSRPADHRSDPHIIADIKLQWTGCGTIQLSMVNALVSLAFAWVAA
jgi:carboxymethylenebutenolidase